MAEVLVRAALNEAGFRDLVAGRVARLQTRHGASLEIELILSDIGWEAMVAAIADAMRERDEQAGDG